MLLMVGLAAACCSGLFSGYGWVAGVTGLMIVMAVTVVLVTALAYGRGNLRAFCLAALCPYGLGFAFLSSVAGPYVIVAIVFNDEEGVDYGVYVLVVLAVYFAALIGFGLLGIWVRRMVEPVASTGEDRLEEPGTDEAEGPFG